MRGVFFVLAASLGALGAAQEFRLGSDPDVIEARRFSTPPILDGNVGAEEWAGMATSARILVDISTSQPSGERGQYWIGYDDEYIYFATRIWLKNPSKILADEFRDNVDLGGNDAVEIRIDTYGTSNDYSTVIFNANGATSLEIAGGRAAKTEWSGQAESASRITATGWEGEVRVPWQLLPLPPQGKRDIRYLVDWYVSATKLDVSTHAIRGDDNKMHTLGGIEMPAKSGGRPILLLPYGYVGIDQNDEHIINAGLDLKTQIADGISFVGTANPDFRNIEGDILNLDFSNFARLANETRPFFQEGASYMLFGHGRPIFASQVIGEFDTGLKLYGNIDGDTRFGLLSTTDFGKSQTTVGSFTHNTSPYTEFTGAFAAHNSPGAENTAGRFNASHRTGDWLLFGETDLTYDEVNGTGVANSFGTFYNVPGWSSFILVNEVSPDFFPRVGFAPETDFTGYSATLTRTEVYKTGSVKELRAGINVLDYDRFRGGHYREALGANVNVTLTNGLELQARTSYENFLSRHDNVHTVGFEYPKNDPYRRVSAIYQFGDILATDYQSTTLQWRFRPVKRLQVVTRYQSVRHIVNRDQTIVTFNWEMDKYQSIGGRVVGQDGVWNWFASYRMGRNLGAEYFLIVGNPNSASFQRSLIFKVSVPLTIGG